MTLLGVNLRVSGYSSQGGRKYMEDELVVAAEESEDGKDVEYGFFAVYDGHGGKEAALFAKEHLMENITNLKYFWSDDDDLVLKAIRDGFLITHLAMWKELDTWPKTAAGLPSTSGTTASVMFLRSGKLYIGHVGDSRIVLGQTVEGSSCWKPCALTKDHKPDCPEERKRIYECGGLVMKKSGVDRVVWKRPKVGHQGPIRRSTDFEEIPFLAVARSLGDLWSYDYLYEEFVVSPEPDVSVVVLNPDKDKCIIIASDGLWNMLSPYEAVLVVRDSEKENEKLFSELGISNPKDALVNNPSKALVDRALEEWNRLEVRADNTSAITILIEKLGTPRNALQVEQDFVKSMLKGSADVNGICSSNGEVCENSFSNLSENVTETESRSGLSRTDPGESEVFPSENFNVSAQGAIVRLSFSNPLQSINISSNHSSGHCTRYELRRTDLVNGMENTPFRIPRWSKSASGQTSLLKLASWSKVVSWRHLNYATNQKTLCVHSTGLSNSILNVPHSGPKHKFSLVGSNKTCEASSSNLSLLLPNCKERTCRCTVCSHSILGIETLKHVSALRQAIKRKYPGSELSSCHCYSTLEQNKCECNMPWKRKPIGNRMGITAFKAINEFRMSQFHRLKLFS